MAHCESWYHRPARRERSRRRDSHPGPPGAWMAPPWTRRHSRSAGWPSPSAIRGSSQFGRPGPGRLIAPVPGPATGTTRIAPKPDRALAGPHKPVGPGPVTRRAQPDPANTPQCATPPRQRTGQLRRFAPRRSPAQAAQRAEAPSSAARQAARPGAHRRHQERWHGDLLQTRQQSQGKGATATAQRRPGGKGHTLRRTRIRPAHRPDSDVVSPGICAPASSPRCSRHSIRTHVRRPIGPPLLYFPAVLAVRFVRILLLTRWS